MGVEPISTTAKSMVFYTNSYSMISGNGMREQRFHLQPSTSRLSLVSIHPYGTALVLLDNICSLLTKKFGRVLVQSLIYSWILLT